MTRRQSRSGMRRILITGAVVLLVASAAASAQGPFGIAAPEAGGAAAWAGPLAPLFAWVAAWQSSFYRTLTAALGALRDNGGALWLLALVSFGYGVFHAAGPGHGKAVITAWLLASGETLRRGVVISFIAALVQGAVAIALVGIAAGVIGVTAMTMTGATAALEVGSYILIVLVGLWLLWTRATGRSHRHAHRPAPVPLGAAVVAPPHAVACRDHHHPTGHDQGEDNTHDLSHRRTHEPELHSRTYHGHSVHECRHAHTPDPALLDRPLTLASAYAAVAAVGIRPCSGAIIVLVFALSQGMFLAGVGATLLMALGTGITVSGLAALAVGARGVAVRMAGEWSTGARAIHRCIEIGGALAVLLLGLMLLGAVLIGDGPVAN